MSGADLRGRGRASGRPRRILAAGFLALWAAVGLAGCGGGGGGGGGGTAPVNQIPKADFKIDLAGQTALPLAGDTIKFDPENSHDTDGDLVSFAWDFQYDGQNFQPDFVSPAKQPASWKYSFPGTYTVALEVEDNLGAKDRRTDSVFVGDPSKALQVVPTDIDFGNPEVGESVNGVVYVFNSGSQVVNIDLVSAAPPEHLTVATVPAGLPVNPNEAVPIPLTFLSYLTDPIAGTVTVKTSVADLLVGFTGTAHSGFTRVGDMTVARKFHTATRLPDGRVLIVGGEDQDNNILDSVEIYDPDTHTFQVAPSMSTVTPEAGVPSTVMEPRSHHTATLLGDTVLVAGGVYPDTTAENGRRAHDTGLVYDTTADNGNGAWTTTFRLHEPRTQHVAVRLVTPTSPDERVVLVGGRGSLAAGDILDNAEILTVNGGYVNTVTLAEPRLSHGAVALDNHRVLVAGGDGIVDGATDGAEVIDVVSLTSTPVTQALNVGRYELTLTPVDPGGGGATGWLAVGGGHLGLGARGLIESYQDGIGGGFSLEAARLTVPRRRHVSVDLGDGRGLLVVGGIDASNRAVDRAEIVAPDGGTVETLPDRLDVPPGNGHRATLLDDGSVLITGGIAPGQGGAVSAAELYVPEP
jgi:PKD repeat protein